MRRRKSRLRMASGYHPLAAPVRASASVIVTLRHLTGFQVTESIATEILEDRHEHRRDRQTELADRAHAQVIVAIRFCRGAWQRWQWRRRTGRSGRLGRRSRLSG